jgi:hypothetical protein
MAASALSISGLAAEKSHRKTAAQDQRHDPHGDVANDAAPKAALGCTEGNGQGIDDKAERRVEAEADEDARQIDRVSGQRMHRRQRQHAGAERGRQPAPERWRFEQRQRPQDGKCEPGGDLPRQWLRPPDEQDAGGNRHVEKKEAEAAGTIAPEQHVGGGDQRRSDDDGSGPMCGATKLPSAD